MSGLYSEVHGGTDSEKLDNNIDAMIAAAHKQEK